jgi:hypothetical protein
MFKPGNRFEEAILRSFNDPSYTPQFFHDLLDSEIFFIIADEYSNTDRKILQTGDNVKIKNIEHDGISWLPVFSSLKFLQEFAKINCSYGRLLAKDFFVMCKGAHVILNPNLENTWQFTPNMINDLLDGSFFQPKHSIVVEKPTAIQVGEPAVYPHDLVKALSDLFLRNKNVQAAYLVQYFDPEKNEPAHPLIGIEADRDYKDIIADAGLVASRIIENKYIVDFIQVKNGDSGLSTYMIEKTKPFYKKKRFGGIFR